MLRAWRHQTIPVVNERFGLEEAILERGPLLFWPNGAAINTSRKKNHKFICVINNRTSKHVLQ